MTGERFVYLGRTYRLMIVKDQVKPLLLNGSGFTMRPDVLPTAKAHFRQWYISMGTEWVKSRIKLLAPKVGTSPTQIEVRDMGYRWGSCGKNQTLYFN